MIFWTTCFVKKVYIHNDNILDNILLEQNCPILISSSHSLSLFTCLENGTIVPGSAALILNPVPTQQFGLRVSGSSLGLLQQALCKQVMATVFATVKAGQMPVQLSLSNKDSCRRMETRCFSHIFKKVDKNNTEKYRAVSLRGIICRKVALAEHIIVSQMYDHLDLHHMFTDGQQSIVVLGVVDLQRLNSLLTTKKNVCTDAIY